MARLPRYFAPSVPLHIILRGNDRKPIVADEDDLRFLRDTLSDAAKRHDLAIHAYVLMTNHLHLMATPLDAASAPKALQRFGRLYVQYFNRRYQRTGTLFEGRYRATAVQAETYLVRLMHYIELNPVRAGMVAQAGDYEWSSYRGNAMCFDDAVISAHDLYTQLGSQASRRCAAYTETFESLGLERNDAELARIRDCVNKGWAMGDAAFLTELADLSKRRTSIGRAGRPAKQFERVEKFESDPN
ncbi:MAG: transposase [Betaproteobacteria bacterium]|nr:MAG: transposase [Betaproteobacteria bacterium]